MSIVPLIRRIFIGRDSNFLVGTPLESAGEETLHEACSYGLEQAHGFGCLLWSSYNSDLLGSYHSARRVSLPLHQLVLLCRAIL